ncbi:MAG TPA: hypothetical protein DGR79_03365 [Clostridiales bacterium]|nr:hypothetical protein [Clostridiales bacterium]
MAVFQLESRGMQGMLKDAKPDRFEDIIALVALYRPGPMDLIPSFCARKHGREKVEYPDPRVEPVLKETYGIMVYQEQVMQMAQIVGGYSLGGADLLRRAMGKKKAEEMAEHRELFRGGAAKDGLSTEKADEIFDLMEKFAGYGFNKSHSAPYALVAYQTAWLKAHYPVEFMAASLTSVMGSSERVAYYVEECRRMGVEVLPPDVNESQARFTVAGGKIRFGLAAVKNLGEAAIEAIVAAREEKGPFRSLYDFCRRVDTRLLNKRAVESLIKAGAFDSLGGHRGQYLLALDRDLEAAQRHQRSEREGQLSLFSDIPAASGAPGGAPGFQEVGPPLPPCDPLPKASLLAMEKEVLGLYLSGHPLAQYQAQLVRLDTVSTAHLSERWEGDAVTVGGMVSNTKKIVTRNGSPMMFATIEDLTGAVEVVIFPSVLEKYAGLLQPDATVIVRGRVSFKDEEPKVIADEIQPLEAGSEERVYVTIPPELEKQEFLERVRAVLELNRGGVPVYLNFLSCGKTLLVDRECWIRPDEDAIAMLTGLVGEDGVSVQRG